MKIDLWRFLGSWLVGKDEVLVDCPENEEQPWDKPIVHDYLHDERKPAFSADNALMTVGEMSSTTIINCVLYSAPGATGYLWPLTASSENRLWKWTKNGPLLHLIWKGSNVYHTWGRKWVKEVVGVPSSGTAMTNLVLWINVDIKNFRKRRPCSQPAFTCHVGPLISTWVKIGKVSPDYDSMAGVDVRVHECHRCFWIQVSLLSKPLRLSSQVSWWSRTRMQWMLL